MGYSPYYIERGRHPMMPLDIDVTARQTLTAPENTKDFVDRIWLLDDELREKRRAVDTWTSIHVDQRRRTLDKELQVGKLAWLSTDGITLGSASVRTRTTRHHRMLFKPLTKRQEDMLNQEY